MTDPNTSPFPWWLWPNVLALDAPAVAVVWQRFLAVAFNVPVPIAASVVLGLVVWGIYLADHRLDGRGGNAIQPRHRFAAAHPNLVGGLAVAALLTAVGVAFALPASFLLSGGILAICVVGYFALIHALAPELFPGGKEMLVGLLFAAGVAVPLLGSSEDPREWFPAVAGFALTCWLNCRLIDRWEEETTGDDTREPLLAIAALLCAGESPWEVAAALGAAVGLLMLLHLARRRTGPQLARILADAVLLTPLVVWCFP